MSARHSVCLLVVCSATCIGRAQNTIVQWNTATPSSAYEIDQDFRTVRILTPGGYTFKFYAHDGSGDPNTGVIDTIALDDPNTATGDFSLLIGYPLDPNDPNSPVDPNKPGALHWKAADLTYDGGTSTILGIHLAGNICGDGDGNHADIYCEVVNGDITVGGSLSEIGAGNPQGRKLQADSITGDITLGEMIGDIETGSLDGDVEVGDSIGGGRTPGDFIIRDDYGGTMLFADPDGYDGSIHIEGDFTGSITVEWTMAGDIEIDGDMVAPCRILFLHLVTRTNGGRDPNIHVHGSITGSTTGDAVIEQLSERGPAILAGTIAIDGSLTNAVTDGPEIRMRDIDHHARGAIVVDYDGWNEGDDWDPDATVVEYRPPPLEDPFTRTYNGNSPDNFVYEIGPCRGDIDNTEALDEDDVTAMEDAMTYPGHDDFVDAYPGLEGSLWYHGDLDCDGGTDPNDYDLDEYDLEALTFFVDLECCPDGCNLYYIALVDIDEDGDVDLADLAALLAAYGSVTEDPNYNPDADFDDDGDVDLTDLAALLAGYGRTWGCSGAGDGDGGGGGGEGGEDSATVTVTVEAYDTGGYKGGGFKGEVDHFVFDLKIEVDDARDDWLLTGSVLDASNDATFRLSTTATTPDQYATFVAAPWTSLPGSATADLAGAYDPPDPNEVFTTTDINLGWYDNVSSNDGPATVMRLVIDVSEVDGADVSEGFGSVYFSTTGPAQQGDILVADLASGTSTAYLAPALKSCSGEFYVLGE